MLQQEWNFYIHLMLFTGNFKNFYIIIYIMLYNNNNRDLKSKNLLVDRHLNVLVCDYGVSKILSKHQSDNGAIGTPTHMYV